MASSSMTTADKASLLGKRNPEDGLKTKPILKKHKEKSEGKEAAIRKKTWLYISNLSPQIEVSDIIDFFKDVGEVVHVRLVVNLNVKHVGYGYVEFASANEANKALQNKNGEYFDGFEIVVAARDPPQTKFCIDHKVWSRDYLRRVSLPIEDKTPSDFVEDVLFVANLSPQTKLPHIEDFFNSVGVVLSVRLIVNHEGKHVGYGFVQFASANQAKKALEKKNGEYFHDHKIFLDVAKSAPYSPRPKYNLAEMLCYDDYLRRENLLIEDDETPDFVEAVAIRKKTLFVTHISGHTKISDIINFFKGVGKVVYVRLIVNHKGKNTGYGFVEFASSNEAKKALEKKNGEYLLNHKISLYMSKIDPDLPQHKWIIDHKVWYEDYLRRESLLIEEDEAVEGLDETPDFVEEVAVRKKTLYVANFSPQTKISDIINIFKDVSKVCGVRLIANHMSQHVGCGFVEFASSNEARQVLLRMKGGKGLYLDVAKIAPYPLRPKYNLAEKLWYEDYLGRESFLIEEDDLETKPNVKKQKVPIFCGKKITFL